MSHKSVHDPPVTVAPRALGHRAVAPEIYEAARPSGPAAAVILAAGLASFLLGLLSDRTAGAEVGDGDLHVAEFVGGPDEERLGFLGDCRAILPLQRFDVICASVRPASLCPGVGNAAPYRLRPSNGCWVSLPMSISSRQRTLTATISPPSGALPRENEPTPQRGQNR